MKIGFFSMHPAPYRDDTFAYLSVNYKDIDLNVYNIERGPSNHTEWNFCAKSVNKYLGPTIKLPFLGVYNKGLKSFLKKEKFDLLIVSGYYPASMLTVLRFAWKTNTPYVLCCDTIKTSSKFVRFKKKAILSAQSFWVSGGLSKKYILNYGIEECRVFEGYYTCDTVKLLDLIQISQKEKLRKELNIDVTEKVFLFIGKLIRTRRIDILLDAIKTINSEYTNYKVIIIGDGDDSIKVTETCLSNPNIIHILSLPYNDIHKYYAIADAYVHPGAEPYSLALVEAAIAGIPIVASKEVGATHDVLRDGHNGYLFCGAVEDLVSSMKKIINNEIEQKNVDEIKEFIVSQRNIEWAADQLYKAIVAKEK